MRILFVSTRPPWPSRRGDQARVAGWCRALRDRHALSVVCQQPPKVFGSAFPDWVGGKVVPLSRRQMLSSLVRRASEPLQVAMHYQPALAQAVKKEISTFRPDVTVVVLSRLGWCLPAIRDSPVVVDFVDSLALNMRNRARRQFQMRPLWKWEGRRLKRWERGLAAAAAAAMVVSERDRRDLCSGSTDLASRIRVVPFGVDLPAPTVLQQRGPVVLLGGNLGYFPTIDGAKWLAKEVWPLVRQAVPRARWWLAGSRVDQDLHRLTRLPGVRVISEPQDLASIRKQCAVAVAPMRSGSGTPIKILEAMADGLPVVATPEAAAGLDDLQGGEVAVGANATKFAAALIRLLGDPEAARRQANSARAWLERRHDLPRVARRFERILESVA